MATGGCCPVIGLACIIRAFVATFTFCEGAFLKRAKFFWRGFTPSKTFEATFTFCEATFLKRAKFFWRGFTPSKIFVATFTFCEAAFLRRVKFSWRGLFSPNTVLFELIGGIIGVELKILDFLPEGRRTFIGKAFLCGGEGAAAATGIGATAVIGIFKVRLKGFFIRFHILGLLFFFTNGMDATAASPLSGLIRFVILPFSDTVIVGAGTGGGTGFLAEGKRCFDIGLLT